MGHLHAFVPGQDEWISTVLVLCLILLLLALASESRGLGNKLQALIAPNGSRAAQEAVQAQASTGEHWRNVLFALLAAVATGELYMTWTAMSHPSFCGITLSCGITVTPIILLATCTALCLFMFAARRLIYHWIHVTFFDHDSRMRWKLAFRLTMAAETVSLTIGACVACCNEISTEKVLYGTILSALLPKMVLFWCAKRVFFANNLSVLHFFAYLCSAELMPLAFLWQLLGALTIDLTV